MQRRSRHVLPPSPGYCFLRYRPRTAIVTAVCLLAASGAAQGQGAGKLRVLSDGELDRLTAGSAAGANAAATAQAIGSAPESGTAVSTVADAGGSPIAAASFANYAATQILSYGSNAVSAQATSASRVFVDGGSGGAGIAATARASGTTGAQTNMQWYAVSTNHADLAFGTVAASACCGAEAGAQVTADPSAGGPYTSEYVVRRQPQTPGQAEQAVDVAVISSTLPIVDPARIAAAVSMRVYSKY